MVTNEEWVTNLVESANFYLDQFSLAATDVDEQAQPERLHSGSFLELTANNGQGMIIGILGSEADQRALSKHVLNISDDNSLSEDEIKDVMKESVNVISGLLKSRLNTHYDDSLDLGIPYFQSPETFPDTSDIRQLNLNDFSICVYFQKTC